VLLTQYCSGDEIENAICGTFSTFGSVERRMQGFGVGKPEGKDHMVDPGVNGKIILRWILGKWDVGDIE